MSQDTTYTFWKLINEYSIQIPIIQRDYAQGRISPKILKIRELFLNKIKTSIEGTSKTMDLNFVYGNTEKKGDENIFIPLDGQQRLTTLFLLHWYLAAKENKLEENKNIISKFTYETRASSRKFCNSLVNSSINEFAAGKISIVIKDSHWFFQIWEKDPTIKAMLVMLDAIHDKFKDTHNLFERLIDESNPPVIFQFPELESKVLNDSLYIKMNSRGKMLTEFEGFKAKFEQLLEEKKYTEQNKEFSKFIDSEWTDLFWNYNKENVNEENVNEGNIIDKPFMRYFYFITEMLYFLSFNEKITNSPFLFDDKTKEPIINYDLIEKVYIYLDKDDKNLRFLFDSINTLSEIEKNYKIQEFFNSIFSTFGYEDNRVALFDKNVNLFQSCIEHKEFGLREKILLFSILKYCVTLEIKSVNQNLRDFIRVIRNLLQHSRIQNITVYKSDLSIGNLNSQLNDICKLISKENIYIILTNIKLNGFSKGVVAEREKIKYFDLHKLNIHRLEDHILVKGIIHNFNIENNLDKLEVLNNSLYAIWDHSSYSKITPESKTEDSLIVRAMLTIGDYKLKIHKCALGFTYLLGNNTGWHTILTKINETESESEIIKNVLPKFLILFDQIEGTSKDEKLKGIIGQWLKNENKKDWRYYFIKYDDMTPVVNYYAWKNGFEIRDLGYTTSNPLAGYHINPYVRTVANKLTSKICDPKYSHSKGKAESALLLWNKKSQYTNEKEKFIALFCKEEGWEIDTMNKDKYAISEKTKLEFNLKEIISGSGKKLLLKENDKFDRIKIAEEFAIKYELEILNE